MTVDLNSRRLFATPQGAKAVAVLDLNAGRVLTMISGIKNPHGLFYSTRLSRLYVSDGVPGSVKVFDGNSYRLIKTIKLSVGADALIYDPGSDEIYVANGEDEDSSHAMISVIDPTLMKKVADVRLTASDIEGMAVDTINQLLYAAIPDQGAVAVIDLHRLRVIDTWKLPSLGHRPLSIVFDSVGKRLFVACRDDSPSTTMNGTLFVLSSANGRVAAELPIDGWVDDIFIDPLRHRVYVSTGVGYIDTYSIAGHGYTREQRVETDLLGNVGGDEEPRDSGGKRRFSEAPPGAGGDIGAYGPTIAARRSRSGIKKLFGELKREACGTSKRRARKSRKRDDHQKEADLNPRQQVRRVCTQVNLIGYMYLCRK